MSIRPPDILNIAPIITYSPTTPYTATGDNTPFNSIDARHDWFTKIVAKESLFTVGKSTIASLNPYTVVALNINTNAITPVTTATSALAVNEVPAVIATIISSGTGVGNESYFSEGTYYYFCILHSKAFDIPSSNFVTTGAEVGCPVYYNFSSEKFIFTPLGITSSPTGNLLENYKGKKIPLGNIVAIFTYNATEYYTIKFGSQEGMGVGLDMAISTGDHYHSSLSDIIAQKSNQPSTYNIDHYLYANKFITPSITIPTFQTSNGLSGVVNNTDHTYTITDTALTSGLANNCRLWTIPITTNVNSGIVSIYISDSVTGDITSNTFIVSSEPTNTNNIVVDIVSTSEIKITVNNSVSLAETQSNPVLHYFVNNNSYFLKTITTSNTSLTATENANVVEFSITDTNIQGANGEHLKGTQLIVGVTETTLEGNKYYGKIVYWYNPNTSQWSEVLSGNYKFYQNSNNTAINYLNTTVTNSTPFSFTFTGPTNSTLHMISLNFITYITPDLNTEIGKLLEYVSVGDLGYYQLSRNEISGQPLGIITEHIATYNNPYTIYLLTEGLWSKEASSASGTIGGMGTDLVIDNTPTFGDNFWDNGNSGVNYGHLTTIKPTDITKQKRIGFCIDSNTYLISIYNSNDFKTYLDEIKPDTTNTVAINDATIQIYPKWARTGLVYDVSGNLGVNQFDTRRIATNATISIQPIAIDVSGNVWLNLNERCPQTNFNEEVNSRISGVETRIANCNATFWSSVSGTLASINFDDTNKVLEIIAGPNTILQPFNNVYLGKQVTSSDFKTLDSYLKYYDSTVPTSSQLETLIPGSSFKHSLPYSGVIILAHTDSTTAENNKLMLFSYNGYSGYGTNKMAFYNVNIYKKVAPDGSTFMQSNWIGSDPGYYPKDYYNPKSIYYKKYLTSKKPNWSTTSPGLWGSTKSDGWAFKLLYGGGVCLRIIGKGVFDTVQLLPVNKNLNTHLSGVKATNPLTCARATHPIKFDNHNAALADGSAKSLWASQNSALSLSTFVQSALASTYSNIDFYTDNTTIIRYSDIQAYADMLGTIGIPNRAALNGTTYLSGSPTVFWIDPKEIWCDIFVGGIYDVMSSYIKVSSATYGDYSDTIDNDSIIEFTLGQSVFDDPEEPFLTMDNVLIGYNEFIDLMNGDSVRFYLKNRKVSW